VILNKRFPVLQPGLITQANGSAYIETEQTKIACAMSVILTSTGQEKAYVTSCVVMVHGNLKMQLTARTEG